MDEIVYTSFRLVHIVSILLLMYGLKTMLRYKVYMQNIN